MIEPSPVARARAEAANYKIADWGTVLRNTHGAFVQEIKRHLVAGTPVLIGIPVHPDFDDLSESNPVYDDDGGPQSRYSRSRDRRLRRSAVGVQDRQLMGDGLGNRGLWLD